MWFQISLEENVWWVSLYRKGNLRYAVFLGPLLSQFPQSFHAFPWSSYLSILVVPRPDWGPIVLGAVKTQRENPCIRDKLWRGSTVLGSLYEGGTVRYSYPSALTTALTLSVTRKKGIWSLDVKSFASGVSVVFLGLFGCVFILLKKNYHKGWGWATGWGLVIMSHPIA